MFGQLRLVIALAAATLGQAGVASGWPLVVHEWGTFTSVAGEDGRMISWRPLSPPSELPPFVHSMASATGQLRDPITKGVLSGTVRMETPVLYFYTPQEQEVSVKVGFPSGTVTEWYPQARSVADGIDWGTIRLIPEAAQDFRREANPSAYYAARATDATPIRVSGKTGAESEKFLFYRGVGSFEPPLAIKLQGRNVRLRGTEKEPIEEVVLFERVEDRLGFRVLPVGAAEQVVARPELNEELDSVLRTLNRILVQQGLYPKEAEAMIETWRSSWFEPGLRAFFVMPSASTRAQLPLAISPEPTELVRVLIGRVEILTPEQERLVRIDLERLRELPSAQRLAAERALRAKYGRFAEPLFKRVLAGTSATQVRDMLSELLAAREPATGRADPTSGAQVFAE